MVSFPHVSPQKPCSHLSLPPYVQISKLGNLNLLQNVHKSIPLIVYWYESPGCQSIFTEIWGHLYPMSKYTFSEIYRIAGFDIFTVVLMEI